MEIITAKLVKTQTTGGRQRIYHCIVKDDAGYHVAIGGDLEPEHIHILPHRELTDAEWEEVLDAYPEDKPQKQSEQPISKAHPPGSMNHIGEEIYAGGQVPYVDEKPPTENDRGRVRSCAYCGSMHPTDVCEAIKAGAYLTLADMKYGYPHKIYLHNIPVYKHGKLYINHLRDATDEEKSLIEETIGIRFVFDDQGGMRWISIKNGV